MYEQNGQKGANLEFTRKPLAQERGEGHESWAERAKEVDGPARCGGDGQREEGGRKSDRRLWPRVPANGGGGIRELKEYCDGEAWVWGTNDRCGGRG